MLDFSRRKFLKTGVTASAGIIIVPSSILDMSHGYVSPVDKPNLAAVGIGGMGYANINNVKGTENTVAPCDVDWKYTKGVFDESPNAKRCWDHRKMYDEMGKLTDGVIIVAADHTHTIITVDAMTMGEHVYCQKPLTHPAYEFRLLTNLAVSTGVVTQTGNQGTSGEGINLVCEWIWNGEIGEATKVECATDRPIQPQGLNAPEKVDRIPNTLNWDLFTGPVKLNPYNNVYHLWNWCGWWDYGTSALGDMACHTLHQPFRASKLGYPIKAEGSSILLLSVYAPQTQYVKMIFPVRDNMPKVALPEVEVHWYNGGMMPERPKGFPEGRQLMDPGGGLTIFHETKDTLICGCYREQPFLLSGRMLNAPRVCRRVTCSHETDWVRTCKEDKFNRAMPKADFSEPGPMNGMAVMGVSAIRPQGLNKALEWDGANMCFINTGDNETLRTCIKDGFIIYDGHPSFNKTWTDPINTKQFAAKLARYNYREGWNLPDMSR